MASKSGSSLDPLSFLHDDHHHPHHHHHQVKGGIKDMRVLWSVCGLQLVDQRLNCESQLHPEILS